MLTFSTFTLPCQLLWVLKLSHCSNFQSPPQEYKGTQHLMVTAAMAPDACVARHGPSLSAAWREPRLKTEQSDVCYLLGVVTGKPRPGASISSPRYKVAHLEPFFPIPALASRFTHSQSVQRWGGKRGRQHSFQAQQTASHREPQPCSSAPHPNLVVTF